MSLTIDDIMKALSTFNSDELIKIQATSTFLLKGRKKESTIAVAESTEELFYEIMEDVLSSNHVKTTNYHFFKRTVNYKKFKEQVEFLSDFVDQIFRPKRLSRIQRRKIFGLMIEAQLEWFKELGFNLSVSSFVNNLHHCTSNLENAFPGYIGSGLMFTLLNSKGFFHDGKD